MKPQQKYTSKLLEGISWQRSKDGLYFSHFETKEEASQWLGQQAVRYHFGRTVSLSRIAQEAKKERGIILHIRHLSRWFSEILGFEIKNKQPTRDKLPEEERRHPTNLTLSYKLNEALDFLSKNQLKSWWVEVILRANIGMDIDEVVVWMDGGAVVFWDTGADIRSVNMHWLSKSTKQIIASWCDLADQTEGLEVIAHNARLHGFQTRGQDYEESN